MESTGYKVIYSIFYIKLRVIVCLNIIWFEFLGIVDFQYLVIFLKAH